MTRHLAAWLHSQHKPNVSLGGKSSSKALLHLGLLNARMCHNAAPDRHRLRHCGGTSTLSSFSVQFVDSFRWRSTLHEPIGSSGGLCTAVCAGGNQFRAGQAALHSCWATSTFGSPRDLSGLSGSASGSLDEQCAASSRRRRLACPPGSGAAIQYGIRRWELSISTHDTRFGRPCCRCRRCCRLPPALS